MGGMGVGECKIADFLAVYGRTCSNRDQGALSIDSVRRSLRRDRLAKRYGKAAEQRSSQADSIGGRAEERLGRLGTRRRSFLPARGERH